MSEFHSELRQDIVSGDWVLISPKRALRPNQLGGSMHTRVRAPKKNCPFEDLPTAGQWPPLIAYPHDKKWEIAVVPNKYPALMRGEPTSRSTLFRRGIYQLRTAVGNAWLLITRDHNHHFDQLSDAEAARVFEVMREAHAMAAQDPALAYVTSFYNYGPGAGASLWHPHYQILTLPVIPMHTEHSFRGARAYYRAHGHCVRCDMIREERRAKVRVIAENAHAIALAPFASKHPFEVNVLPKKHWPSLRETPPEALRDVAILLRDVLTMFKVHLTDPDVNFFVHDTPLDNKNYAFHHWHIEAIPRITIDAGFEFSTRIAINVVDPDHAASVLRGKKSRAAIRPRR